jgi:hypothetical protein
MDAGALQQGLTRLIEAELLFVRGEHPDATYTFKSNCATPPAPCSPRSMLGSPKASTRET